MPSLSFVDRLAANCNYEIKYTGTRLASFLLVRNYLCIFAVPANCNEESLIVVKIVCDEPRTGGAISSFDCAPVRAIDRPPEAPPYKAFCKDLRRFVRLNSAQRGPRCDSGTRFLNRCTSSLKWLHDDG